MWYQEDSNLNRTSNTASSADIINQFQRGHMRRYFKIYSELSAVQKSEARRTRTSSRKGYVTCLNPSVIASRSENPQCCLLNERIAEVQEELLSAGLLWQVDDSSLSASARLSIQMDGLSVGSKEMHGGRWQFTVRHAAAVVTEGETRTLDQQYHVSFSKLVHCLHTFTQEQIKGIDNNRCSNLDSYREEFIIDVPGIGIGNLINGVSTH